MAAEDATGTLETGDLRATIMRTGLCVARQDRSLRYTGILNAPPGFPASFRPGADDAEIFASDDADRLAELKRLVINTARPARTEIAIRQNDGARWFEIMLEGDENGIVSVIRDISREKRVDDTMRALLREVSHRSKNLLAIILSIASQTGRHSADIQEFLPRFQGRLQSLAFSQDLVTSSNWRGTMLRQLVEAQVARLWPDRQDRVRFSGVNPWLDPNATLHLGLGLHELAANSVRFGALADGGPGVEVTATIDEEPGFERRLLFRWSEPLRAGAGRPDARRFGTLALERIVPASIDGSASLEFNDGYMQYELTVPEGQFSIE